MDTRWMIYRRLDDGILECPECSDGPLFNDDGYRSRESALLAIEAALHDGYTVGWLMVVEEVG